MSSSIFSDSWYRIADARVSLLPSVSAQAQLFRGKTWYVLKDGYNQNFFRVTLETWQFIQALTPTLTVQEIWEQFVKDHPLRSPSREEVILIISQLHTSNLLFFQDDANNLEIFKRIQRTRRKEFLNRLSSVLSFKIPIWNPARVLAVLTRWTGYIPVPLALLVYLLVLGSGGITALHQWDTISDKTQGIISVDNLPWLYVCLSFMKLIHEFAHGIMCTRYGGQVRTLGLMFLMFTPLPYVDVTSSWSFANRWHRMLVGVAGMAVELFIASVSALLWANTGPGLLNSLFFNLMIIGSVSSLIFNGNPLLRFDAYYILSDHLEIPNLYLKAQKQCLYLADKYILGTSSAQAQSQEPREARILGIYGVSSFLYLMFVSLGITFFLLDKWFPLGLLALAVILVTKIVLPLYRLGKHLNSQKILPNRTRAWSVVAGTIALALLLLFVVPFPYAIKAPGILEAAQFENYFVESEGVLQSTQVRSGDFVKSGQVIAQLQNADLRRDLELVQDELSDADVQYRKALSGAYLNIEQARQRIASLQKLEAELQRRQSLLTVRAHFDGQWISPSLEQYQAAFVQRGQLIGQLVNSQHFRFSAVIPQEQARDLFNGPLQAAEVRIAGQADQLIHIDQLTVIPYQSDKLVSPALGWMGGGDIAVQVDDKAGNRTKEPYFLLYGALPSLPAQDLTPMHGLTCMVRVERPARPLAYQFRQFLLQLVQKRYSL